MFSICNSHLMGVNCNEFHQDELRAGMAVV